MTLPRSWERAAPAALAGWARHLEMMRLCRRARQAPRGPNFVVHWRAPIPPPKSVIYTTKMTFALAPHAYALLLAEGIYDRVMAKDGLIFRPKFVSKAVLGRLRTGIRALEAFLRNLLILMALDMEHDLIYIKHPENLARAKAKMPRLKKYSLVIYPPPPPGGEPAFFSQNVRAPKAEWDRDAAIWGKPKVPIGNWLHRLDYLKALARDPIKKAKRLAYKLARYRHGILLAPSFSPRLMRRWGTETSATFDAMNHQVIEQSRRRPPPHPPPRRGPKPMITLLSWGPV